MRMYFSILAATSLLLAGCNGVGWLASPDERKLNPARLQAETSDVYEAVIQELMTRDKTSTPRPSMVVISDSIVSPPCFGSLKKGDCATQLRNNFWNAFGGQLANDTREDFLQKCAEKTSLKTQVPNRFPHPFISAEDEHRIFKAEPSEGWEFFGRKFPQAAGILSLSQVGFDPSLRQALVYTTFVCGGLCGQGEYVLLKRRWGKWIVITKSTNWIS